MEHTGVVEKVEGGSATIRFERSTACKNCGGCMMVGEKDALVVLPNTLQAEVGDAVRVELHARRFVQANLLAYGIPLGLMLAGLAIGTQFGEGWAAGLGIAGVAGGYGVLRLLEPRFARKAQFRPRMIDLLPQGARPAQDTLEKNGGNENV